jgi:MFS family permease
MKYISKTVWVLSVVSLLTDTASEMLYPIMPIYLRSIGFSVILIGVLEGLAEATAGLSKGYFGKLSDASGKRVPYVQWGYALSAISKPMLALWAAPLWVFGSRTLDRLGKGLRTGARDALLSDEATTATKGRIFGFHRSMDTLGAAIGPALALAYLYYHPEHYGTLFLMAAVPGALAVLASLFLNQKHAESPRPAFKVRFLSFLDYSQHGAPAYRRLLAGLLVFALINSSDVFLLIRAREAGLTDTAVIGFYIFYNLVYALGAWPLGILADKLGLRPIFILGLLLFATVYAGMAMHTDMHVLIGLFVLYGLYAAATEGIAKAWISNIVPKGETATAIGLYAGLQSICALLASTITGFIWYRFGAQVALGVSACGALCVAAYLLVSRVPESPFSATVGPE